MKKELKDTIIAELGEKLKQYPHFYLVDLAGLNAQDTSDLRRKCFKNEIKLIVVKNTLLHRALETADVDFEPLYASLKGNTAVMFTDTANKPAKLLKEYKKAGIPVPDGVEFKNGHKLTDDEADALVERLGLPIFVKPAANGSSYGITRVTEKSQLAAAIDLAGEKGDHALCEECITGMEITVPVIGNDDPKALMVVEIVTGAEFYDLKVKYEPSYLHHVLPARLDEKTTKLAQEYAVRAHVALGCRGASRTDFIVTEDGTPVILETNTIPGMTETSLLPDSARRSGIEFPELCKYFVELALEASGEC